MAETDNKNLQQHTGRVLNECKDFNGITNNPALHGHGLTQDSVNYKAGYFHNFT